ncbi:Thermosome subunit beta (Fragment) [Seminavis robusta]|uniref:T-complex protein 1 subunit eta n=1 Tax=Seminavis robusta TaxID=568900 RepID=A0A9N8E7E7_9STRA
MASNPFGMRPGIILLREGTDTSQGKPQLISNINACYAVADAVRTTLGPSGRDKLVFDGSRVTISNDGATIMKLLEIEHPAARTLVDISMSQDAEVGDGTTSVVMLAGEILQQIKPLVEEGVPPQIIRRHLSEAGQLAVQKVLDMAVSFEGDQRKDMLLKCASTALNSKLIASHQDLFSPMVVDAVELLAAKNRLDDVNSLVGIKRIPGGDVRQSFWVQGVAFKKTFSYAGFDQMTKKFDNPKVLLLNVELELKSEKENAEVRITDPDQYQSIVDAEWQVIYDKMDACINCGANIVMSKLPIGDLATQYFADKGLFCAGRVPESDMKRVAQATGAAVQTTTSGLSESILGTSGVFEERQVGDQRFNVFTGCPSSLTSTIVLRGGTEQFIAESERSVHDALMVVKRAIRSGSVVAGGGAVEMQVSRHLKNHALTIEGKGQLVVNALAKALEVIPQQLSDNAGFDATDILSALRRKHAQEGSDEKWFGVDVKTGSVCDTFETGVWEPSDNKSNSFNAAVEAACVILSIDETIIAPKSQDPGANATGLMNGQGKPMSNMMNSAMAASQGGARTGQLGQGVSYMKGRG